MKNQELIQGLRDMLAFVEANQDFDFCPTAGTCTVDLNFRTWYMQSDDVRRVAIANLTRRMAHAGKVDKLYTDSFAFIRLNFAPAVKIEISTMRETVCERVVVGKKLIPAQPERVIPAQEETTVEEVEWRCHPVMTAGSSVESNEQPTLGDGGQPVLDAEYESMPF